MLLNRISDRTLEIKAPAKINLFLEVLNRRDDGYHNINSLFQAVSLYDVITFSIAETPGVSIEIKGNAQLTAGQDNLIARAYNLMRERYKLGGGLDVMLEKVIPVAAGLGGGSSDAAATISACNLLFNVGLSRDEMMRLSLEIGSDLPFFFSHGQALIGGRGEVVKETNFPMDYWVVLIYPALAVTTAASYALLKRGLTISKTPFNLAAGPRVEGLFKSLQLYGNDFENVHLKSYPELGKIAGELLRSGAVLTRMTGSGPTMFGLYYQTPDLEKGETFSWGGWQLYTVRPVDFPSQA